MSQLPYPEKHHPPLPTPALYTAPCRLRAGAHSTPAVMWRHVLSHSVLTAFPMRVSTRVPWMFVMSTRVSHCMRYPHQWVCQLFLCVLRDRPQETSFTPLFTGVTTYGVCGVYFISGCFYFKRMWQISHSLSHRLTCINTRHCRVHKHTPCVAQHKQPLTGVTVRRNSRIVSFSAPLDFIPSHIAAAAETCRTGKYKGLD